MLERIRDTLKGSRHIEIILLLVLAAFAGLCIMNNTGAPSDNVGTLLESRLEDILSCIDGIKSPEVMITETGEGEVLGVVVIAYGTDNIRSKLHIQNAICTLLNIDIGKIEIINRK